MRRWWCAHAIPEQSLCFLFSCESRQRQGATAYPIADAAAAGPAAPYGSRAPIRDRRPPMSVVNEAPSVAPAVAGHQIGNPIRSADDTLTIDNDRLYGEGQQRVGDPRHTIDPIVAAPAEHPDAITIPPADEPETILFDLVDPLRTGRNGLARGRPTGLYEAGRAAGWAGIVPMHAGFITVERT